MKKVLLLIILFFPNIVFASEKEEFKNFCENMKWSLDKKGICKINIEVKDLKNTYISDFEFSNHHEYCDSINISSFNYWSFVKDDCIKQNYIYWKEYEIYEKLAKKTYYSEENYDQKESKIYVKYEFQKIIWKFYKNFLEKTKNLERKKKKN